MDEQFGGALPVVGDGEGGQKASKLVWISLLHEA